MVGQVKHHGEERVLERKLRLLLCNGHPLSLRKKLLRDSNICSALKSLDCPLLLRIEPLAQLLLCGLPLGLGINLRDPLKNGCSKRLLPSVFSFRLDAPANLLEVLLPPHELLELLHCLITSESHVAEATTLHEVCRLCFADQAPFQVRERDVNDLAKFGECIPHQIGGMLSPDIGFSHFLGLGGVEDPVEVSDSHRLLHGLVLGLQNACHTGTDVLGEVR